MINETIYNTFIKVLSEAYAISDIKRKAIFNKNLDFTYDNNKNIYFVNKKKRYGFIFKKVTNKNFELCSVFTSQKGQGFELMADIVFLLENHKLLKNYSTIELNCFEGYLQTFYNQLGFRVYNTVSNHIKGGPRVLYMRLKK